MNKKLALILIPIFFSFFLLGGHNPKFKHRHHSRTEPVIKALEESSLEDARCFVKEAVAGQHHQFYIPDEAYPSFKKDSPKLIPFKVVSIVTRPPPSAS